MDCSQNQSHTLKYNTRAVRIIIGFVSVLVALYPVLSIVETRFKDVSNQDVISFPFKVVYSFFVVALVVAIVAFGVIAANGQPSVNGVDFEGTVGDEVVGHFPLPWNCVSPEANFTPDLRKDNFTITYKKKEFVVHGFIQGSKNIFYDVRLTCCKFITLEGSWAILSTSKSTSNNFASKSDSSQISLDNNSLDFGVSINLYTILFVITIISTYTILYFHSIKNRKPAVLDNSGSGRNDIIYEEIGTSGAK